MSTNHVSRCHILLQVTKDYQHRLVFRLPESDSLPNQGSFRKLTSSIDTTRLLPRSSTDTLTTAKVKFKRKKPTVSAYRSLMVLPSSWYYQQLGDSTLSPVATIKHNDDHRESPPESTFRFESPKTSE